MSDYDEYAPYIVSEMRFYWSDSKHEAEDVAKVLGFQAYATSVQVQPYSLYQREYPEPVEDLFLRAHAGRLERWEKNKYFEDKYSGAYANPELPNVIFIIRLRFPGEFDGGEDLLKVHKMDFGHGGYGIYTFPKPNDRMFTVYQVEGPTALLSVHPQYDPSAPMPIRDTKAILQTGNPRS